MRVAFAADHAGAALKDDLVRRLAAAGLGHEVTDLGGDGSDPLDDMNILTLGSRVIGPEPAWECVIAFLGAWFSGEERHRRRLDKVIAIEAAEA